MATNFPTSIDSFTNPSSGDTLDSPSHAAQHTNINDAMVAVQTKLGVGSGTIGTWTSYTPTLTNITIGSGTVDFKYVKVNEIVFVNGKFTLGAGSSVDAGFFFSMPPGLDSTQNWSGSAHARVGSTNYAATCSIRNAGTAYVWIHAAGGTYTTWALASNTVPGTWSSGNYFYVNFFYRAA